MAPARTAVYVYCLVAAARRPAGLRLPAGLPGGGRPELTSVGDGLFLVSSVVPLDVYGPRGLERRLGNLDWVAKGAVAHEAVVEHVARLRRVTVVPMKMFTMFSTMEKAVSDIRGRRHAIDAAARRVAGCEEWGVRITRAPAPAESRTSSRGSRPSREASSGAAFLRARKAARDDAQASRAQSLGAAQAALLALQRLARGVRRRESERESGSNPPLLEAAFLVASGARARFNAAARRHARACADAGATLALTGPWPAYNFVGTPEEES
jgi:hypothetical protein